MPMTASFRYCRNPEVVDRAIDGERLLIPIRHDATRPVELMVLNKVGAAIWDALEVPSGAEPVVQAIVARFEVPRKRAERDVESFLARLAELDLIVREAD